MKNRNLIDKKLLNVEGLLKNLLNIVNTQESIESYRINIGRAQNLIEETRDLISLEPVGPGEWNNH